MNNLEEELDSIIEMEIPPMTIHTRLAIKKFIRTLLAKPALLPDYKQIIKEALDQFFICDVYENDPLLMAHQYIINAEHMPRFVDFLAAKLSNGQPALLPLDQEAIFRIIQKCSREYVDNSLENLDEYHTRLAKEIVKQFGQPANKPIVLPEKNYLGKMATQSGTADYFEGWNKAIDDMKRLNGIE